MDENDRGLWLLVLGVSALVVFGAVAGIAYALGRWAA